MSVRPAAPGAPGAQLEILVAPIDSAAADPAEELEDELSALDDEAEDEADVPDPPAPAPAQVAAPPPGPAPDPLDPEDTADGVVADGEFVRVPRAAFKKIKDRAKRTAVTATAAAADAAAAAAGFPNLHGAMSALRTVLDQRRAPRPDDDQDLELELDLDQEMPVATPPKSRNLSDNVRNRFKQVRDRHAQELAAKDAEIHQLKEAQKTRDAQATAERAAAERRASLSAHGFEDAEYAEALYSKASASGAVDVGEWAAKLKAEKPYLFKSAAAAPAPTTMAPVAVAPVTQQAGSAPLSPTTPPAPVATPVTTAPAPAPQPAQPADGGAPVRNAKDMTRAELQAARNARGWGSPGQSRPVR